MVTLLVSVDCAKPETDVLVLAHVKGKLTYFSGENAKKNGNSLFLPQETFASDTFQASIKAKG